MQIDNEEMRKAMGDIQKWLEERFSAEVGINGWSDDARTLIIALKKAVQCEVAILCVEQDMQDRAEGLNAGPTQYEVLSSLTDDCPDEDIVVPDKETN